MSGVVSGVGKVFTSVVGGVAKVGKAILGVGTSVFTGGAAAGAGGLTGVVGSMGGGSVLGSILTGAITQAGVGALLGGVIGSVTGAGFGKGALYGALGGAVTGGLSGAMGGGLFQSAGLGTPQAYAPSAGGAGAGRGATPGGPSLGGGTAVADTAGGGGLMSGLNKETLASMVGGAGDAVTGWLERKQIAEERQKDREVITDEQDRRYASYKGVVPGALNTGTYDNSGIPTPGEKWGERQPMAPQVGSQPAPQQQVASIAPAAITPPAQNAAQKFRYVYDKESGSVVQKAIA
jgi:hypothetical protein